VGLTREILDALKTSRDLRSIYYDSGHVFDGNSIWRRHASDAPFPNWRWEDFTDFDIHKGEARDATPTRGEGQLRRHSEPYRDVWRLHSLEG
jgi:hypothetical protein